MTRYYIPILLTILASVFLPPAILYSTIQKELLSALERRQEQIARSVHQELQLRLGGALTLIEVTAASAPIREYLHDPHPTPSQIASAQEILTVNSLRHGSNSLLLLLNRKGEVVLTEHGAPLRLGSSFIRQDDDNVLPETPDGSSISFIRTNEGWFPLFMTPVRGQQRQVLGSVGMVLRISVAPDMQNKDASVSQDSTHIFIIGKQGELVFFSDSCGNPGEDFRDTPAGKIALKGEEGLHAYVDQEGIDRIGVFMRLSEAGWMVVVSTPTSEITDSVHGLLEDSVLLTLCFGIAALFLVTLFLVRMSKELRLSSSQMEMVLLAAGMGTWQRSMQSSSFTHDAQWGKICGIPHAEAGSLPASWLWDRIHPEDLPTMRANYERAISGKQLSFSSEFRFQRPSGGWGWIQMWGRVLSKSTIDGSALKISGVIVDIKTRKQNEFSAEERKRELEALVASRTAELEQTRNTALAATQAKTAFLSTVSHEIRTPMNAIIGFTSLFERENLNQKQLDYLAKIKIASDGLLSIIDDVLDLSKIEAGKLNIEHIPFRLRSVIEAVSSIVEYATQKKSLEFKVSVDPEIPDYVAGDPTRLQQVLLNLMNNAVKFTPRGTISVMLSMTPPDGTQEEYIRLMPTERRIYCSVSDTGIGMSPDQVERIFHPFSQADSSTTRRFGGTGLGLAITKQLVELMHGTIRVDTEADKGSTFRFSIVVDIVDDAPDSECPNEYAAQLKPLKPSHILVVEDNLINQEIARAQLEGMGMTVSTVENGKEAVEIVQNEAFALVFMDMQMPVMDGISATRTIRGLGASFPHLETLVIIAMTANAMTEDRQVCLEAGMNDHLAKPFNPESLRSILLRWL